MSRIEGSERRDLFPGALEMMVLQLLRRGPLHGYAVAQLIKRTSDDLLQIEEGSLYPALQRMLQAGWVSAEWGSRHGIAEFVSTGSPVWGASSLNAKCPASSECWRELRG